MRFMSLFSITVRFTCILFLFFLLLDFHAVKQQRCTIINGGGTIVGVAYDSQQVTEYVIGNTSIGSITSTINFGDIQIKEIDLINKGSHDYTDADLFTVYETIYVEFERSVGGSVVFVCGTDAISTIGAWLSFLIFPPGVLVLSGAIRPQTALSADGPVNVLQAVRLAVNERSRGRGVLASLNQVFGHALHLRKVDNTLFEAYKYSSGRLGRYINDKPIYDSHPAKPYIDYSFDISKHAYPSELPNVQILYAHHNVGDSLFRAAIKQGAEAVILCGMGAGSWPTDSLRSILPLAESSGVYILFASQSTYGFVDKSSSCGSLEAGQCRLLVQLMLWLKPMEFDERYRAGTFRGHIHDTES